MDERRIFVIMGIAIRRDETITGYRIGNTEIKIEQFADDCTLILDESHSSFENCMKVLSEFSCVSGLSLNTEKTQVLSLSLETLPAFVSS